MAEKKKTPVSMEVIAEEIFSDEENAGNKQYGQEDLRSDEDACLVGVKGSRTLFQMTKTDSVIGAMLRAFYNPILSCKWVFQEIPDITPEEQKALDAMNWWIFKEQNFGEFLKKILLMLPTGFSCFERYFVPVDYDGVSYVFPKLEERLQYSIDNINYKTEIVDQILSDGHMAHIPMSTLVFFTNDKQGQDMRGVSLLRSAYTDYELRKTTKLAMNKGVVRSIGVPVGHLANGATKEDFAALNKALKKFSNLDRQTNNYFIVNDTVTKFELLNSTFNVEGVKDWLAFLGGEMTLSTLTQFLNLGQNKSGGSYNLGSSQADMFLNGLQYIIDYIEQVLQKEYIEPMLKMNFNVDPERFQLAGLDLNKKANEQFGKILLDLKNSGAVRYGDDDEALIRKMFKLPEVDFEERVVKDDANLEKASKLEAAKPVEIIEKKDVTLKNKGDIKKLAENRKDAWNNTSEREQYFNREEKSTEKIMRAQLTMIGENLKLDIKRVLNNSKTPAEGLKDIEAKKVKQYKTIMGYKLAGISRDGYRNAKRTSTDVLKLSEPINPNKLPTAEMTAFVVNQSDTLVADQVQDMRDKAIFTANGSITKGYSKTEVVNQAADKIDEFVESGVIKQGAILSVAQSINTGEMDYFDSIKEELWGYRIANASPSHPYCKSVVGNVYSVKEVTAMSPPYHFGCNSYLEPIYKKLEEEPVYSSKPSKTVEKTRNIF